MMKFILIFIFCFPCAVIAQQPDLKQGLENFVKENTVYPSYSRRNCIQGTVKVAFKVNAKGDVSSARVESGYGIDLDEEALRLVRISSGKWIVPVGHDTTTLLIVPVNFVLSGYNCERVTKAEIARAIQSYKDREQLVDVITNYYRSKEKNNAKMEDEKRIVGLKNELGIDDDYLDNRVEAGVKKIKQGDKQGACKEFNFVKYMGSDKANEYLSKYCN
jgi:TonB family protein